MFFVLDSYKMINLNLVSCLSFDILVDNNCDVYLICDGVEYNLFRRNKKEHNFDKFNFNLFVKTFFNFLERALLSNIPLIYLRDFIEVYLDYEEKLITLCKEGLI